MTRVLHLDLVGGAAGDMLLAALLDLGASRAAVDAAIAALGLEGVELSTVEVHPAGLRALRVDVTVRGRPADEVDAPARPARPGHAPRAPHLEGLDHPSPRALGPLALSAPPGLRITGPARPAPAPRLGLDGGHAPGHVHRPYAAVRALLLAAALEPRVRALALAVFERLAGAEGAAHGVPVEEVTFHEVGADDALVDVVGTAAALVSLGVDEVVVSPVPLGRGLTRGAHGPIPLPGPATLHLLRGAPLEATALEGETVTPTGAAILAAVATRFGPVPSMVLERVGVGAGHRSWPDRPNVVRALLGAGRGLAVEEVAEDCVVEANLDDMHPEHAAALEAALFAAGAVDVWRTPIAMKKGRLGVTVSALARRAALDAVTDAFLVHSTTLGVRVTEVARRRAAREVREVETPHGRVRVKVSPRPSGPPLVAPEHDDCARLAAAAGLPVRAVHEAALRAAWAGLDAGG